MKRIAALCALLACLPADAQPVYRWVDGNGRVQYGDKPPPGAKAAAVQSRINSYSGTPTVSGSASAGANGETRPAIKMYVTDWCGYCKQAMGARGVPVILVGTQRMNGYSEARLAQMLKAAGY